MNRVIAALGNGSFRAVLTPQAKKRRLIQMTGSDSFKFLQNLTTKKILTDVEADESGEFCDYAAFLNTKGRMVSEALLIYRSVSRSWLLDVHEASLQPLLDHFQQYKMRNKIMLDTHEINTAYRIWSLVATSEEKQKELSLWLLNQTSQMELLFYQDPRFPLAFRLIAPAHINPFQQLPPIGDSLLDEFDENNSLYDYVRLLAGVPENPPQIISGTSIPFECNMDLQNGIDYNKGCYIGQELVARTHHRGAVRKRFFPLVSLGSPQDVLKRTGLPAQQLLATLQRSELETSSNELIPKAMLRQLQPAELSKAPASDNKRPKPVVDVELDALYEPTSPFPQEGAPIMPITSSAELESVLSGKGLLSPIPTGPVSASRLSKASGGSSYNVGLAQMRDDAWHGSPHLLFFSPSGSSGTILQGVKPWWYGNYTQWRSESEHKLAAQAAADL